MNPVDFEPTTPGTMAALLGGWGAILVYGAAGIGGLASNGFASPEGLVGGIALLGLSLPIVLARRTDAGRLNPRYARFVGGIVPTVWALSMSGALGLAAALRGGDFVSTIASLQAADAAVCLMLGAYLGRRHAVLGLMGAGLLTSLPAYNWLPPEPNGPAGPFFLAAILIAHAAGAMYYLGWRSRQTLVAIPGLPPLGTSTQPPSTSPEERNPL